MPQIKFAKNRQPIEAPQGANLMVTLLESGVPVASSCHGQGVCSKCRIHILEGRENLSKENELERTVRDRLHIKPEWRLSCQTAVNGDILIDTNYW